MEFYTVKEICDMLRISRQAIARAISDGRIKATKIGGQYRIEKKWFEQYVRSGGDM